MFPKPEEHLQITENLLHFVVDMDTAKRIESINNCIISLKQEAK